MSSDWGLDTGVCDRQERHGANGKDCLGQRWSIVDVSEVYGVGRCGSDQTVGSVDVESAM
jgi:hypothetical protein